MTSTERGRRWRKKNRERLREWQAQNRQKRREALRAYANAYYADNRAAILVARRPYAKVYRAKNRRLLADKQSQRDRADPAKKAARLRDYRSANRPKINEYQRQRRALVRALPGMTSAQLSALKKGLRT